MVLLLGCTSGISKTIPDGVNPVATQWHAPLPHEGRLEALGQWWAQFDDSLLLRLLEDGQRASPTLAQASGNIADARAAHVAGRAALLPSIDASASASRGRTELGSSKGNAYTAGLQASWELDIFGANRAATDAAEARLESSQAGWHDARVSLTAEIATTYVDYRACEAQTREAETDARSRAQTSRLTRLSVDAGFQPPSAADLADASAAQGRVSVVQQKVQCDLLVKTLVALTAQDEIVLRGDLASAGVHLPRPAELSIASLPASVVSQRPDVHAAALDLMAASADSDQAQARRWPRITLSGNITPTRLHSAGVTTDGTAWGVGPITITMPLFDGGVRKADAQAALIRYEAAATIFTSRVREAIREIESSLVTLQSTTARRADTGIAVDGFQRSYQATESAYRSGASSVFDLEDARRSLVAARSEAIGLDRDRVNAWIALYRATGGGWTSTDLHKAGVSVTSNSKKSP
ncbi:efflux transporter outer membrane subunit [Pseudomonas fluorescens]|uniref:efflux transporter outer membrane subunit n=1 Tax=Pseudomonas fluorescens TaxID=294 RepID=UPI001250DD1A|nr:efflux transporter outer membrane subunit [Pseudomonas fluorescens]VVN69615.1 Solvent efflux pump outer membrane protein SrpC [Pseudomonas fluorescens]